MQTQGKKPNKTTRVAAREKTSAGFLPVTDIFN